MTAPQSTIWSMDRHTQAKHEMLRRYLGAWVPILINYCGRARIIDGFAGPGEYENGEIGSPLIALQTLLTHSDKEVQDALHRGSVELICIEQDPKRSQHLQKLLEQQKQELSCPPRLQPRIITGTFVDEIGKLLTIMERQHARGNPHPTFVFIDPFGYSHTPLGVIASILRLPMCEVLITCMSEEINRFLSVDYRTKEQHYDTLFGTRDWRQITHDEPDATERMRRQHDLYRHQLLTAGGAKYVRSFRMRNQHNATDYFLFFGTNNRKGLTEMKRAMWGVDPTGAFEFSDFSNPYQPLLLTEPNYADLQRLLNNQFRGQTVPIEEIEEYVLAETPYVSCKQNALAPMEASSPPKIRVHLTDPGYKRRKGTFPEDKTFVEFL
ncbi:MAG TPA: three-Cys-motif partner protein TcmP [Ktedonobacteraceae bacterium]|nr:three-Cys-motif partner protein TcmP [Ktedonobacteraceae bacterium]